MATIRRHRRNSYLASLCAATAAFAVLLWGAVEPAADAKSRDDLEKQQAQIQSELSQLRIDLEGTSKELQDAYANLEEANKKLPLAQATLEVAESEYAAAEQEHQETVAALELAESQRDEVTQQLAQDEEVVEQSRLSIGVLARDAMMGRAAGDSDLMVLMGASSIDQAAGDMMAASASARARDSILTQAQESVGLNKNRKARLESVTTEIAALKVKAEEALAKAEQARLAAEAAKAELEALQASLVALAGELEAQKAAEEAKQADLENQKKQVQADLNKLLEEEARKANVSGGGAVPPPTPGFYGWPLSSLRVASPFGWRVHPIYGTRRHHDGVDLSASCSQPIFASAGGKVIFTGWAGGYGNRVVISHGNVNGALMFSTYNHIENGGIIVSTGQTVVKGQQVARVGTTGASTGCHLHFEIGVGSATGVVNPMNYIS